MWRRRWLTACFVAFVCVCLIPTGAAAAIPKPLPVPGAFRLSSSNGYTLYVLGGLPRQGDSGELMIYASAKGKGASYRVPATVTETSMQADLGELGEISVTFHRSGQATKLHCGKTAFAIASGNYEGTIVFHGEEGFTSVEATAAPSFVTGSCGGYFISGGSGRYHGGAELYLRNPALGPGLTVRKIRPNTAAQISAWTTEYSNEIRIERYTSLQMPTADFTYDRRLRKATVKPPAPFSGIGRFDLGKKAGQRWSGDLSVDLPGKSALPLMGPTLRAFLVPSGE